MRDILMYVQQQTGTCLDAMSTKTLLKCRGAFNNWALVEEARRGWKTWQWK